MRALIYDTVIELANQEPEQHTEIRQKLYNQLSLPFEKQLVLYAYALGPASSGKLENRQSIDAAVDKVIELLGIPER